MINRYKTAIRTIKSNKLNTLIKILGISLSLITLLFITVFVSFEQSYDKHITGADNIYRVVRNWQEDATFTPSTPTPLAQEMLNTFPELEASSRLSTINGAIVIYGNKVFNNNNALAVDSSFFSTLNLQLKQGNENTALANPGTLVISESKSKILFGDENPIGKQLEFEGGRFSNENKLFVVTGVFNDYPNNTHYKPDFLMSLKSFEMYSYNSYRSHNIATYIKLKDNTDASLIESKFPEFMRNFYGDEYYDFARSIYLLQPIKDIHLDTWVFHYGYETSQGNSKSMFLFPLLAVFIVIIATINYLNLTISEGIKRTKGFGINKLSGAGRMYFIKLFSAESQLILGFSLIILLIVSPILLSPFNTLMGRNMDISLLTSSQVLIINITVVAIILFLSAIVPTIKFARKNTYHYISGKVDTSKRKSLIHSLSQTTQFAICIFLFIGSIIIYKQLVFMDDKTNEEMNIENVLVINNARYLNTSREAFKQKIQNIPAVKAASLCTEIPGNGWCSNWGYPIDSALESAHVNVFECDNDYFNSLSINIKEGRFFSKEYSTDIDGIVLNETAIKRLGWEDDPIGKRYYVGKEFHVIGVAPDIHFEALQYEIASLAFIPNRNETSARRVLVKLDSDNLEKNIAQIKTVWAEFVPHREIDISFLNQEFEQWYTTERRTSTLSIMLSLIAIMLASLGLFAAILFKIQIRIKEIGIRKVNGAKVIEIIRLLNKEFVIWVAIAFIIASPIAFFAMRKWLESFAYRTIISWWIFPLAGLVALAIALTTVSWQTFRAARRNPIEALRYE